MTEVQPLLKAILAIGFQAVHLEGPSLSVRNVPVDVAADKIQVTLQKDLPQIVFLDMFPPTQQGALHRGVGKMYVIPEAWTSDSDAHIAFRTAVTPNEIEEPCLRVQHDDALSHLGPMYVRKWKEQPRRSQPHAVRIAAVQQSPNHTRPAPAHRQASPSVSVQCLQQQMDAIAKASIAQFEVMSDKHQALHDQLSAEMTDMKNAIAQLTVEVQALNVTMAQVVTTLSQNTKLTGVTSQSVLDINQSIKNMTVSNDLKRQRSPTPIHQSRNTKHAKPCPPQTPIAGHQPGMIHQASVTPQLEIHQTWPPTPTHTHLQPMLPAQQQYQSQMHSHPPIQQQTYGPHSPTLEL